MNRAGFTGERLCYEIGLTALLYKSRCSDSQRKQYNKIQIFFLLSDSNSSIYTVCLFDCWKIMFITKCCRHVVYIPSLSDKMLTFSTSFNLTETTAWTYNYLRTQEGKVILKWAFNCCSNSTQTHVSHVDMSVWAWHSQTVSFSRKKKRKKKESRYSVGIRSCAHELVNMDPPAIECLVNGCTADS